MALMDPPEEKALTVLSTIYLLVAGLYLTLYPWTFQWLEHPLVGRYPEILNAPITRGLVSGIGIIHIYLLAAWRTSR